MPRIAIVFCGCDIEYSADQVPGNCYLSIHDDRDRDLLQLNNDSESVSFKTSGRQEYLTYNLYLSLQASRSFGQF